jgi:CHASE1-domain containing sensor protein
MIAATSWPDAAVAIAGVILVLGVSIAVIAAVASTLQARMSVQREIAYRKLAEESATAQNRTADELQRTAAALGDLRERTGELERLIKTVD